MNGMLFLERFSTCDHFFILHFLELQVNALNHNLVRPADHLEDLALTLLVSARDYFDLIDSLAE